MNEERRKAWRSGLKLDARYEYGETSIETKISDLSINGAFVEAAEPLPAGSKLNLIFVLPDGMVVETIGEVIHSQSEGGMGVTFTTLSREQAEYIRQFIRA